MKDFLKDCFLYCCLCCCSPCLFFRLCSRNDNKEKKSAVELKHRRTQIDDDYISEALASKSQGVPDKIPWNLFEERKSEVDLELPRTPSDDHMSDDDMHEALGYIQPRVGAIN